MGAPAKVKPAREASKEEAVAAGGEPFDSQVFESECGGGPGSFLVAVPVQEVGRLDGGDPTSVSTVVAATHDHEAAIAIEEVLPRSWSRCGPTCGRPGPTCRSATTATSGEPRRCAPRTPLHRRPLPVHTSSMYTSSMYCIRSATPRLAGSYPGGRRNTFHLPGTGRSSWGPP